MIAEDFEQLTIGEVARRAGVNVQTVRYYERRDLLPEPDRSGANYRIFALETRETQLMQRKVEIFSAGCPACEQAAQLVADLACPSCDVDAGPDRASLRAAGIGRVR